MKLEGKYENVCRLKWEKISVSVCNNVYNKVDHVFFFS